MRGNEIPVSTIPHQDTLLPASCEAALKRVTERLNSGHDWASALLEAVNLWTLSQEVYQGRFYRYLIQGEAFDLKLLTYRLSQPSKSLIPLNEYRRFLLGENLLGTMQEPNIRRILGPLKYQGYLNYWYGITVEMALQLVVFSEVRKEQVGRGRILKRYNLTEVYGRIYGSSPIILFEEFKRTFDSPDSIKSVFGNSKEFLYWLFKYRLSICEKERIASDTKKALEWLQNQEP